MGLQGERLARIVAVYVEEQETEQGSAMKKPAAGNRTFVTSRLRATALCAAMGATGLPAATAQTAATPVLEVPARSVPVPTTVSPQLAKISGTRDLLLSNTVRVHRKLRQAGVEAMLQVYEGQSHAQYYRDDTAPETKEAFEEIAGFFDKHLGK
jgi:acetyl esterase/lipase